MLFRSRAGERETERASENTRTGSDDGETAAPLDGAAEFGIERDIDEASRRSAL